MYDDQAITEAIIENRREYEKTFSGSRAHCFDGPGCTSPAVEAGSAATASNPATEAGHSGETQKMEGALSRTNLCGSAPGADVQPSDFPDTASTSDWPVDGEVWL